MVKFLVLYMVSYEWYKIFDRKKADIFPSQEITCQIVDNKCIVLMKLDGSFYVLDNYCPHKGGPLAGGSFDKDGFLVCPWHHYQYDPKTGSSPPGFDDPPVKHYKTELRDDGLYVSFPSKD